MSDIEKHPTIGQTARRTRTVTTRDIELFTELTGDRKPLHYDDDLARRSRFGEIIVQGGVTTGLLNAVVAVDGTAVVWREDLGQ